MGRLIDGIRQKGPQALINIADIAQRESFDVIGKASSRMHAHVTSLPSRAWRDYALQSLGLGGHDTFLQLAIVPKDMPILCPACPTQGGYGKDFQASRDIDNSVNNTFRWISNDLEEIIKRVTNPLRRFQTGKVCAAAFLFTGDNLFPP